MMREPEHLVYEKQLTEWGLVNLKRKRLEVGALWLPSNTCQVVTEKIVSVASCNRTVCLQHYVQQGKNSRLLKKGC